MVLNKCRVCNKNSNETTLLPRSMVSGKEYVLYCIDCIMPQFQVELERLVRAILCGNVEAAKWIPELKENFETINLIRKANNMDVENLDIPKISLK